MGKPLRILLVEDSEDDALLLLRHLQKEGHESQHLRVDGWGAFSSALRDFEWDLVVSDFKLSKMGPFAVIQKIQDLGPNLPIIIVSGDMRQVELVNLMRVGVRDVIEKNNLARLGPVIEREMRDADERAARQRAETRLRDAMESLSEGFALYDPDDRLVVCNDVYKQLYNTSADLMVPGTSFEDILREGARRGQYPGAEDRVEEWVAERLELRRSGQTGIEQHLSGDRWVLINEQRMADGSTVGLRTDITRLKHLELALQKSRDLIRAVFDNAPMEIYLKDMDGRHLFAGRAVERVLGIPVEQVIGRKVCDLLPKELVDDFERDDCIVLRDGRMVETEYGLSVNGVGHHFHSIKFPVTSPEGTVEGVGVIAIDITDRKRAQDELRASEAKYRNLYQKTPVMLHSVNAKGVLINVSDYWLEYLGYDRDDVIGRRSTDFLSEESRRYAQQVILPKFMKTGRCADVEYQVVRKNGEVLDVLLTEIADRNTKGEIQRSLAVMVDITERKRNQEKAKENETLLRAFMNNSPDIITLKDAQGRFLFVNEEFTEWHNTSAEAVQGKTAFEVCPNASSEQFEKLDLKAKESKRAITQEFEESSASGAKRWVRATKFPIISAEDPAEIIGIGNIDSDITDQKNSQNAMKKQRQELYQILRNVPRAIITIDNTATIRTFNPAAEDTFGYTADEAIGQNVTLLMPERFQVSHDDYVKHYRTGRNRGLVGGAPRRVSGRRRDGTEFPMELMLAELGSNAEDGFVGIAKDITDQLAVETQLIEHRELLQEQVEKATAELRIKAQELESALAKEKELNELERQFVSMASHEFRTPLAIVASSTRRLIQRKDALTPEEVTRRTAKIERAVERMTRLMESTLSATRMDNGKFEISPEDIDLRALVEEICSRQQELNTTHRIMCDLTNLPATMRTDGSAIDQVITNLLSNAVKYAPNAPDIHVKGWQDGGDVFLTVQDNGLGIDEDDLANMFERFFRAKTSTGIPGTGIGLSLVRYIVEAHGGDVTVESRKSKGSVFTIRLPINGVAETVEPENEVA